MKTPKQTDGPIVPSSCGLRVSVFRFPRFCPRSRRCPVVLWSSMPHPTAANRAKPRLFADKKTNSRIKNDTTPNSTSNS